MRSRLAIAALAAGAALWASGCTHEQGQRTVSKGAERVYPYEMSEQRRRDFLSALVALPKRASYEEMRARLGQPDSETSIRGKQFDAPVSGRMVTYYLRKSDPLIVNLNRDQYIHLQFDNDGVLADIVGNVPDVISAWRKTAR